MKKFIKRFLREEEGATMVEYGLMIALVALVAMVGATAMGIAVDNLFSQIAAAL